MKLVIMDYNKGKVIIRNTTPKEDETGIYKVSSDCEYMVVDELCLEVRV